MWVRMPVVPLILLITIQFRVDQHGVPWGCSLSVWTFSWCVLACWWICSNAEKLPSMRTSSPFPSHCEWKISFAQFLWVVWGWSKSLKFCRAWSLGLTGLMSRQWKLQVNGMQARFFSYREFNWFYDLSCRNSSWYWPWTIQPLIWKGVSSTGSGWLQMVHVSICILWI